MAQTNIKGGPPAGHNVYGYDAYNKLLWTAGSGTPTCGTTGKCITYDAFGRMVEQSTTSWSEIWYTQVPGSKINMSGTTANYGYWPSPGRGTFVAGGSNIFFHQDWLGNDRVVSQLSSNTVLADRAYAPYGQQYNTFGSTNPVYGMFAGITGDFDPGVLFDTPNRELAQYQGRWLNPDPAGAGWNQYAYVTNPNSQTDPSGLECLIDCDDPGGLSWDGGSGFTGNDYFTGAGCDPTVSASCIFTPYTPFPGVGQGWGSPGGGGSGFSFSFNGFDGGCDSDYMPCGLPMPGLWQLLGLPSLSCPQWMGPQCGGINPAMDAGPANNATISASNTPWYKNSCVMGAIGKGLLHSGVDLIGLLPGGGDVAGAFSLFHGAAGVSNGTNILLRVQTGIGIVSTAAGSQDTSTLGGIQTAVGVVGLVPVLGQGAAAVSIVLDGVRAGMDISQCY